MASGQTVEEMIGILHQWGIHTLGQLAALNKEDLRDRLGAEAVRLWERANGTATRPLKFVQPPETFSESFEFDHEIETAEPLLFILRRFLEQLTQRLSSIYLVARELTLTITFSGSCENERTAAQRSFALPTEARTYERNFKIPQPTNDIDLLFRMLQTHLENFKSDHPILAVALSAEPIRPVSQQFGLFETALRNPHQLYETLARLTALVGNDRVGTPVLEETHRPDAFRMETFDWRRNDECRMTNDERNSSRVALRRFRPPANAAIFISNGKYLSTDPSRRGPSRTGISCHHTLCGQIVDQVGPFLLSGNWWDGASRTGSWARAEYDLQLDPPSSDYGVTGAVIVRAHESPSRTGTKQWRLDGIYD